MSVPIVPFLNLSKEYTNECNAKPKLSDAMPDSLPPKRNIKSVGIIPFVLKHHEGYSQVLDSNVSQLELPRISQDDCLNFVTFPMLFGIPKSSMFGRGLYNFRVGLMNTFEPPSEQ